MGTQNTESTVTIIGKDAKFKGEIEFASDAKILGQVEGVIRSSAQIDIVNGSKVDAMVDGSRVEVDGEITGDVIARDLLKLAPNATVNGDITAGTLVVAEGASFLGHCRVGPSAIEALETKIETSKAIPAPEAKPVVKTAKKAKAAELEPEAVGVGGEAPLSDGAIDPEFSPPWKQEEAKQSA